MAKDHDLTVFQQVLLATDGTVTDLIALYAGEPMRVRKLQQEVRTDRLEPALACVEGTALLDRRILLSGAAKNYLYAESCFVLERVPESIREQMLTTDRPVGLLWKSERLETFREIVEQAVEPCVTIAHHFDLPVAAPFVSRTYLVHHRNKPLGKITERWPLSYFRRVP
jgi:chorismate-pyruvate lyase